jgi:hypothetical protein
MADRNVYTLTLESFVTLIDAAGFKHHQTEADRGRVTFDVKGDNTVLRVHVILGRSPSGDQAPWYVRFLVYSLEIEPLKSGVGRVALFEWLNERNADVIFGRYYFDEKTDTVAFEVSIPCNGGVLGEDFEDLLRISTLSVDRAHEGLKKLVGHGA